MSTVKKPQTSPTLSTKETMTFTNIFHLSSIYFTVVFLTGFILGAIRQGFVIPHFHLLRSQAELIEMPFMVLSTILWARWLVRHYKLPAVAKIRIAVGGLAMGILVIIELFGEIFVNNRIDTERDEGYWVGKGAFVIAIMLFGAMPWVLIVVGC